MYSKILTGKEYNGQQFIHIFSMLIFYWSREWYWLIFNNNRKSYIVKSRECVDKCIHSFCEKRQLFLHSRKGEPCIVIINTYFRVFLMSPTHGLAAQTTGLLMAHHSATLFAPKQITISVLPSSGTIHIYFLMRELYPSCVGAICCFLLLWFAFIRFQQSSNAAIVCCWNLPKDRNMGQRTKRQFSH